MDGSRPAYRLITLGAVDLIDRTGRRVSSLLAQPKRLSLLIYLATRPHGHPARRDELLALFWPESDEGRARNALSQALHVLRRELTPAVVVGEGREAVGIDPDAVWCDARKLEEGLSTDPAQAAALYGGDFLPSFHVGDAPRFQDWVEGRREALRRSAGGAALAAARLALEARNPSEATALSQWAYEVRPLDEDTFREHILILDAVGERGAALQAFEGFRGRLARELGVEPSPETSALIEGIRTGSVADPSAHATTDAGPRPRGPTPPPAGPRAPSRSSPVVTSTSGRHGSVQRTRPWSRWGPLLGLATAGAAALLLVRPPFGPEPSGSPVPATEDSGERPVLMVHPLEGLGEEGAEAFGRGLSEDLLVRLASLPDVRVIAPAEAWTPGWQADAVAVASGADFRLSGSVRVEEDRVRVAIRLVADDMGEVLLARSIDFEPAGLLAAQSELALQVAEAVAPATISQVGPRLRETPTDDPEVWTDLLRVRDLVLRQPASPSGNRLAMALVESVLARDSLLADAHALRAVLLQRRAAGPEGDRDRWAREALAAATRAVELGPERGPGHSALAAARLINGEPVADVLAAAAEAIRLQPGDPYMGSIVVVSYLAPRPDRAAAWNRWLGWSRVDPRAEAWNALSRWMVGDLNGAETGYRDGLARFGPDGFGASLLHVLLSGPEPARAVEELDVLRGRHGWTPPPLVHVAVLAWNGRCGEAVSILEPMLVPLGGEADLLDTDTGLRPETLLGHCLREVGDLDGSRTLLERSVALSRAQVDGGRDVALQAHYDLVRALAQLGRVEEALEVFEDAVEKGWPFAFSLMGGDDPLVRPLRGQPSFEDGLARAQAFMSAQAEGVQYFLDPTHPTPDLDHLLEVVRSDLLLAEAGVPPHRWPPLVGPLED
jgi:pentatricopeptide repeat protein